MSAMLPITIEEATINDVSGMARLRAEHWGHAAEWEPRITAYMIRQQNPQFAKDERVIYVAVQDNEVVGMIAGQLTQRFDCQGELQWLNVAQSHRGNRIASMLMKPMVEWFVAQGAKKVCVNVSPTNKVAQAFYARHGAEAMDTHWLVWNDIAVAAERS